MPVHACAVAWVAYTTGRARAVINNWRAHQGTAAVLSISRVQERYSGSHQSTSSTIASQVLQLYAQTKYGIVCAIRQYYLARALRRVCSRSQARRPRRNNNVRRAWDPVFTPEQQAWIERLISTRNSAPVAPALSTVAALPTDQSTTAKPGSLGESYKCSIELCKWYSSRRGRRHAFNVAWGYTQQYDGILRCRTAVLVRRVTNCDPW